MRREMILSLCLVAGVTACGSPTPTSVSAPAGPDFGTGIMVGSGGRAEGDSSAAPTSVNADSTTTAAFGGWTGGSGNNVAGSMGGTTPASSDSTASAFGGLLVGSGN